MIVVLGKPQDLDESLSLYLYSLIEFCNSARAVYINSETPLILKGFEDNHYNKDGKKVV